MPVSDDTSQVTEEDSDHNSFCKCLALSIAYSANVGGVATLTGSPPNLIFKNQIDT